MASIRGDCGAPGVFGRDYRAVLKLNSSITKLTVTMERLVQDMREQKSNSHDAHKRLWEHNEEQDAKLLNHETRINNLERK